MRQRGELLTFWFRHLLLASQGTFASFRPKRTLNDHILQDHVSSVKGDLDSKTQDSDETVKIAGGSVIIDPLGNVLAGPLRGSEGYVHS